MELTVSGPQTWDYERDAWVGQFAPNADFTARWWRPIVQKPSNESHRFGFTDLRGHEVARLELHFRESGFSGFGVAHEPPLLEIEKLEVVPTVRREGIATQVVDWLQKTYPGYRLCAWAKESDSALGFWATHGWTVYRRQSRGQTGLALFIQQ